MKRNFLYWQYIFVSNGNPPHAYELGGFDFKHILILINLNKIFIDQDLFISSLGLMPWCSNFWRCLDMFLEMAVIHLYLKKVSVNLECDFFNLKVQIIKMPENLKN